MSEGPRELPMEEAATVEEAPRTYRRDGAVELDQRTVIRILLEEPVARNYAIAALAALAVVFMVLVESGGDISAFGGLAIVVLGVAGIALRWPVSPIFVLLIVVYFMYTPFGDPVDASYNTYRGKIEERRFHFMDVVVVLAVVVYTISHYRLAGLLAHAIAREGAARRNDDPLVRRPLAHVRPTELGNMLLFATALVIVGQLVWLFVTSFEVVPRKPVPLKVADPRMYMDAGRWMSLGASRFFILAGILIAGTLLARLVFGYWRLRTIDRTEAQMILLDEGWRETSRERSRLEKWRAWGHRGAEPVKTKSKGEKS